MKFSLSFLPKEDRFFFLLHQSTLNMQKVALCLHDLMEDFDNVEGKVQEIKDLEEFGDEVIHDITLSLHRTFVTPIDREDIMSLAGRLDDVIDAVNEAAQYMFEYKITSSTEHARKLTKIIVDCAAQLEKALGMLSTSGSRLKDILPITVEINRLESEADKALSQAMGHLFSNGSDVINILKWRDIYNTLEEATDWSEDAANVLEGIVLKHS